ncbi:transcriptional coactivator/pterin dehydratase [Hypoxylon rubiginosum]|uniref:Transcriptional coactivator/pterin dehydratase n=1 Tax=Hypoxylon rubiginosum TaxID=110542 RepID=A0ACC0DMG9_9PEZI|nr:transcriptional coactivator/pterin dehydratase [Hypoxylon rubiginosum]
MHPGRPLLRWASIAARAAAPTTATTRKAGGLTRCCTGAVANPRSQRRLLLRAFTCSSAMATTPQFSPGVDEPALTRALESLLASAELGGRWQLVPGGEGLERSFKFKTFAKTWDFMTAVSLQCKLKNHHPEWSNVYNTTYIRWTTHNPKGLSAKDVELAAICDRLAKDFSEIVEDTSSGDSCALKQVADRAVTNADDCCTPKK